MISIRAQSAAAVSRQNLSQGDNSLGEIQTISSQNSSTDENLTSEDDHISSQNLLIISSSLNRQLIRSIFEDTKDIMSIISVLFKAKKIASLNKSAD
jgi:hypothetical protein